MPQDQSVDLNIDLSACVAAFAAMGPAVRGLGDALQRLGLEGPDRWEPDGEWVISTAAHPEAVGRLRFIPNLPGDWSSADTAQPDTSQPYFLDLISRIDNVTWSIWPV